MRRPEAATFWTTAAPTVPGMPEGSSIATVMSSDPRRSSTRPSPQGPGARAGWPGGRVPIGRRTTCQLALAYQADS